MIKPKIGPQGEEITFLVDTGAERSTIQHLQKGCKISKEIALVVGAKGEPFKVPILENVEVESENKICLNDKQIYLCYQ